MADDRYLGDDDTQLSRSELNLRENRAGANDLPSGHALPGGRPVTTGTTGADDPDAVRAEIAQTRARMSDTIDEIEEALARKRDQLHDRLDFLAPVRERPLMAAGAAFAVGLLIGLITGGDDDEEEEREPRLSSVGDGGGEWRGRSDLWEKRARRLLRVAREQEQKLRDLQERYGTLYAHELEEHGYEHDFNDGEEALTSSATGLRDSVLHGLTGVLTDAFRGMGR
jgi:ElaB/YqjD/DUF883 family membrane-anchored ribosome-binding protein